jgi:hypothetical protein
MIASL